MEDPKQGKVRLMTPALGLLMCINLASALAFYLLMVMMTDYSMYSYGVTHARAGLSISTFVGAALLARVLLGNQIDRFGPRKTLTLGLALNLASSLLYLIPMPFTLFNCVRVIHGIAFALMTGSASSAAAMVIPAERRAEGIGYYAMMQALATGIGPFVAVLIIGPDHDYLSLFMFSALVALIALLLSLPLKVRAPDAAVSGDEGAPIGEDAVNAAVDASAAADSDAVQERGIARFLQVSIMPLAFVLFLLYLGYSGLVGFIVPYTTSLGLPGISSQFFVAYAIAILVSRPFAGRIVDRFGENAIMYYALVAAVAGHLVLSAAQGITSFLLAAILLGFGIGTCQSVIQAVIARDTPPSEFGRANSTFLMNMDLGTGIGPVVIGAFVPLVGYAACYIGLAGVACVALLVYHFMHGRLHSRLS